MISTVLFLIALVGWWWLVFANHFTWSERRKELCKIGDHWLTKKGSPWHNKHGEYFTERHCRACDHMEVKRERTT
jgi:hypothetical protein